MERQPKRSNRFWIELVSNSRLQIHSGSVKKEWFLFPFDLSFACFVIGLRYRYSDLFSKGFSWSLLFHLLNIRVPDAIAMKPFICFLNLQLFELSVIWTFVFWTFWFELLKLGPSNVNLLIWNLFWKKSDNYIIWKTLVINLFWKKIW